MIEGMRGQAGTPVLRSIAGHVVHEVGFAKRDKRTFGAAADVMILGPDRRQALAVALAGGFCFNWTR